jgi:acetaldehyde dehydrogenase / alcohol dehydrogenase
MLFSLFIHKRNIQNTLLMEPPLPVNHAYIDEVMNKARNAADEFAKFNREQTDHIVRKVFEAAFDSRFSLAEMAHRETGIGKVEDKVIKNIIATKHVYEDIKDFTAVGIISNDVENGVTEIARPLGPIFAITPVTNPTSTVLFKILISLKTRNPLVISPHGAARKCSIEAARICYEAAIEAGAPENCIQWLKRVNKDEVIAFMAHRKTALILATGSVGLVRAAYSSGNPTIGIGPGNVPVYVGKTTDVDFAVDQILLSKTFDNGTVCASEQAVVVSKFNSEALIKAFRNRGAYFMNPDEIAKLEPVAFNMAQKVMNATVIGKSAHEIAQYAGFEVPEDTTVLIAPLEKVGIDSPLSFEILAPILAFYEVDDFEEGIARCREINRYGGLGHTASIFSNDEDKIRHFAETMNAGRILVNQPSSQGALGGTYNDLQPSMTLACGTGGKNITTDNISARHLINIQRIAKRKVMICTEHFREGIYCCNAELNAVDVEQYCQRNQDASHL